MTLSQNPVDLLTHIPSLDTISLTKIKCYTDHILACVLLQISGAVGELHDRIFGAERVKGKKKHLLLYQLVFDGIVNINQC